MPVFTNMQADPQLSEIQATDTKGLLGTAGAEVTSQALIDAIADRVMTKLLSKSQVVNNLLATATGDVLDATQGKALKDQIDVLNSNLTKKSPTNHASTATTYGVGNTNNYGHVKISDNYTSSAGNANNSIAASSQAVFNTYNTLNSRLNNENIITSQNSVGKAISSTGDEYTKLVSVTVPKGTYIVIGRAIFTHPTSSGNRKIRLYLGNGELADQCVRAPENDWARLTVVDIFSVSANTTLSVGVSQSSGIEIAVNCWLTCVKLKS